MRLLTLTPLAIALATAAIPIAAQWTPLQLDAGLGPFIGTTTTPGAIHVVSQGSGVYSSTDDGLTWDAANNGLPVNGEANGVRSVGAAGGTLFAGTTSGIHRSTNGGASWTNVNGPLTANDNVYAAKWRTFGGTTMAVYSGTIANGGGIARTTDNGTTWSAGHTGMGPELAVTDITGNGTALFAATTIGLFRSDDMAATWTAVAAANFSMHAVEWANGRLVCIVAGGNYRFSTDEGQSWTVSAGSPDDSPKGELCAFEGKLYAISGTTLGCMWSTDDGTSFGPNNVGLAGFDMYGQYQFHHAGDRLYMGTVGDLYMVQGTSTYAEHMAGHALPAPRPTLFQDHFQVDLTTLPAGGTIILLDMMGREVGRHAQLPAALAIIPRQGLASGRYACIWTNDRSGARHRLGPVIAE